MGTGDLMRTTVAAAAAAVAISPKQSAAAAAAAAAGDPLPPGASSGMNEEIQNRDRLIRNLHRRVQTLQDQLIENDTAPRVALNVPELEQTNIELKDMIEDIQLQNKQLTERNQKLDDQLLD